MLQRFYDQLCALVEAQRMSDPLSLMIIHKVGWVVGWLGLVGSWWSVIVVGRWYFGC